MSVEAAAIALNHSRARGTARLVLIGIANHDGDGGSWPSLDTLARYAAVDRRNVQRAIDTLVGLGEIRKFVQAGGLASTADHRRPNLYEFLLRCPAGCDGSKWHRTPQSSRRPAELFTGAAAAPPLDASTGVAAAPPEGVAAAPPETSPETSTYRSSRRPSTERAQAHEHTYRETTIGRFCAECGLRDDGRKRINWISLRVQSVRGAA